MNTEELEKSLRAEFEGYLKNALASARQDVSDLQRNFEAELEKQRSQMDEAFRVIHARLDSPVDLDKAFSESISEHLRLARDEGASITATALGEAEKLQDVAPDAGYGKLRNAINEIKSKSTQAAILRALVDAASNFAPRGAFFIVKNDHLVGWKVFGDVQIDENAVRSVHFPVSAETILSDAVNSLSSRTGAAEGTDGNAQFLEPLSFGAPESMIAIPLPARGRGVAVLYADGGFENSRVNTEALETLVSVAGLTVELLAGGTAPAAETVKAEPVVQREAVQPESVSQQEGDHQPEAVSQPVAVEDVQSDTEYVGEVAVAEEYASIEEAVAETEVEQVVVEEPSQSSGFAFAETNFSDQAAPAVEHYEEPEPEPAPEPVVQDQPKVWRSDRTVDLPIEVSDAERRPHSDARRFARLLVSEIKLYNEQKVAEGRDSGDIYEVLKEAIDRSREMYDKRVQPDVASKFDYFHYELVNNLAEGDEEKLGAGYLAVKA